MSLIAAGAASLKAISPLVFATEVASLVRDAKSSSIIEYSKVTRADSMTILDARTAQLPYADSILSNLLNIVTAYYLQAISVATVEDARVIRTLGKFNPDRDMLEAAAGSKHLSMMSLESAGAFPLYDGSMSLDHAFSQENVTLGRDAMKEAERGGLSVGKLINVDIKLDSHTVTFPMNIRLLTTILPPNDMRDLLASGVHGKSIKERWHLYKAGRISFFKDFLLCQDLIDEHRSRLVNDKTGLYRARSARNSKNKAAAILSGQPSIAQASALIVMNLETAKEIEHEARIRFNDFRAREKFFATNLAMIVCIVDPDWDNITLYYHSIPESNTISVKELDKMSRSKNGPDILDVLNSLREVKAPSY